MDEIKPKQRYTVEELQRIYSQMRPEALLIPMNQENSAAPDVGPRFMIYLAQNPRKPAELGQTSAVTEVLLIVAH